MRATILSFALGLLSVESALAGPCKPHVSATTDLSTTGTVTEASTESSTETVTVSTSEEPSSSTILADTTTTEAATTDVTTTTTAAADITTTSKALTSSTDTTSSETEAASTTTTTISEPAPIQTFNVIAAGGTPVDGTSLEGDGNGGSNVLFNIDFGNYHPLALSIEANTGRLMYEGHYICVNYVATSDSSTPSVISTCPNFNAGPNQVYDYLTCSQGDGKLACTAPAGQCSTDEFTDEFGCTQTGGTLNQLTVRDTFGGSRYNVYISSSVPANYIPVSFKIQAV
ncbi:hypothetical protein NM208_g1178 [Fusarium decemcellulare]|uniref:Uncharacterized protein n=1 Tax=Fusarium decemcellulare TaxID=57161 RepID=A0ACC1SX18_9HYPO|nr:hypothetical protein NM208_g1178 [Fusarium decemcellulare]